MTMLQLVFYEDICRIIICKKFQVITIHSEFNLIDKLNRIAILEKLYNREYCSCSGFIVLKIALLYQLVSLSL